MARLRVHIFLSGLDSEFDQVRGEILRKDPKFDLQWAAIVQSLSTRLCWLTKLDKDRGLDHRKIETINYFGNANNLICTHCGEKGHSQQLCYEIIGYPE
ncbi:hypothetical protein ACOSQ4_013709 [Xanthoceras sorbifolium]